MAEIATTLKDVCYTKMPTRLLKIDDWHGTMNVQRKAINRPVLGNIDTSTSFACKIKDIERCFVISTDQPLQYS